MIFCMPCKTLYFSSLRVRNKTFEFEFLVQVQFFYKLYHFEQNSRGICEIKITSQGCPGYSKKFAKIYLQVGSSFDWNDPTLTSSHTLICTGHQQSACENFDPGTCLLKRQFLSMLSKIAVIAQLNCDSKCPNHHHQLFKIQKCEINCSNTI